MPAMDTESRAYREKVKKQVFKQFDKEGNGALGKQEMCNFARFVGFEGTDSEWNKEFDVLCRERGIDKRTGVPEAHVLQLLEDDTESGCYCSTKELVQILNDLLLAEEANAAEGRTDMAATDASTEAKSEDDPMAKSDDDPAVVLTRVNSPPGVDSMDDDAKGGVKGRGKGGCVGGSVRGKERSESGGQKGKRGARQYEWSDRQAAGAGCGGQKGSEGKGGVAWRGDHDSAYYQDAAAEVRRYSVGRYDAGIQRRGGYAKGSYSGGYSAGHMGGYGAAYDGRYKADFHDSYNANYDGIYNADYDDSYNADFDDSYNADYDDSYNADYDESYDADYFDSHGAGYEASYSTGRDYSYSVGHDRDYNNGHRGAGDGTTIFFGGASYDSSAGYLQSHFGQVGRVTDFWLFQWPDGRSKGMGLAQYQTVAEARRAIRELSGVVVDGREILVFLDEVGALQQHDSKGRAGRMPNSSRPSGIKGDGGHIGKGAVKGGKGKLPAMSNRIFFSGAPFESLEISLRSHFEEWGPIQSFTLFRLQDGRSRGMGLCTYINANMAMMALNGGVVVDGWELYLQEHVPASHSLQEGGLDTLQTQPWSSSVGYGPSPRHRGGTRPAPYVDGVGGIDVPWDIDPERSVFFARVPRSFGRDAIRRKFLCAGEIKSFTLFEMPGGISRGMGVVEYFSFAAAMRAYTYLHDEVMGDRQMLVDEYCPPVAV
mmetsp:Transcript_114758/g.256134  ORF Transcript_114758/g.256134 Transcript_114758/m.256134 type:complete len:711 (+) Transcript_114758:93-2225(+)